MTSSKQSPRGKQRWTRREFGMGAFGAFLVANLIPSAAARTLSGRAPLRAINIMNFIRAEEPREPMDLMLPVREQMRSIRQYRLPATWLLQYDAMVEGPFAGFLKDEMPADHETGIWFEMNRKICDDAGIAWRGNEKWEWDYHVPVAYSIGYKPDERRRLADTAMATHKRVFGREAKTVASWNLDAVTVSHLADAYGIDAFGNCRDQLATDGFTIWGGPIAGYYPSRNNAWSPALSEKNQIASPMFRLLGQDPVYYYDKVFPYPDTMEPVWPSGQSEIFIRRFLEMIAEGPTQDLAYAQLGQENSFGWAAMKAAFPLQMERLAEIRHEGKLVVETMGSTGRRFKQSFHTTPAQAQVMLEDPFGNEKTPERTIWYQSRYYRANLHFRGDSFYLRDLHVYSDLLSQPFLTDPVTQHGIEQRMLAALDGYHWSDDEVQHDRTGKRAMGRFVVFDPDGRQVELSSDGTPRVSESPGTLEAVVPLAGGGALLCTFTDREIEIKLRGLPAHHPLGLVFQWVPERSAFTAATTEALRYKFRGVAYAVRVEGGEVSTKEDGAMIRQRKRLALRLLMAQPS